MYLSDLAPRARAGEYIGMQAALMSLSMMLAPSLGTAVLEHFGARTLWTGSWIVGGVSAAMLAMLPGPRVGSGESETESRSG